MYIDCINNFVLNLVINGLPSIQDEALKIARENNQLAVLNLVINGLPSIHQQ